VKHHLHAKPLKGVLPTVNSPPGVTSDPSQIDGPGDGSSPCFLGELLGGFDCELPVIETRNLVHDLD
jgi:hypothetical protein